MIVVGGTYLEECANAPDALRRALRGSGLRAAAVVRQVAPDITLCTAIDEQLAAETDAILGGLNLDTRTVTRVEPVAFSYFTPLSPPVIRGRLSRMEPLEADTDDIALVFGMMEGEPLVRARTIVYDPQQPLDLADLDIDRLDCERFAIVANATETRALSRTGGTIDEAARELRGRFNADVLVTKRGARGALVTTAEGQETAAPYPTPTVWPIGSGDAFAAGFAWSWGSEGASPAEAAAAGSRTAAHWCATASLDVPAEVLTGAATMQALEPRPAQIYLAAPFFTLGQRWLVELARGALRSLGGDVFSPMHDVGAGGAEVAEADLAGLSRSQGVLALLDEDDPGTLFEAGWATARAMPVVGYAERPDVEGRKMLVGSGAEIHADISTAVYRALWAAMGSGARSA